VPGAPRPAVHRLVEWAFGCSRCGLCTYLKVPTASGSAARPSAVTTPSI
jgi:hypothetical protein